MKIQKRNPPKGISLLEVLLIIAVVVIIIALLGKPAVTISTKNSSLNGSVANARSIAQACHLFASDWDGEFPSAKIASQFSGDPYTEGDTLANSNEAFNLLFISKNLDSSSEEIFSTKEVKKAGLTWNQANGDGILTAGENHFSYVTGLNKNSQGEAPLVTTMTNGNQEFYNDLWDGKAVVARVDGSASSENIAQPVGAVSPPPTGIFSENVDGSMGNIFSWVVGVPDSTSVILDPL